MEYGGLARECSLYDEYNDTCYRNMIVYLVAPSGMDFYNDQKVSNNSNACWVQDGVYRHVTKNNIPAAVPLLELAEP